MSAALSASLLEAKGACARSKCQCREGSARTYPCRQRRHVSKLTHTHVSLAQATLWKRAVPCGAHPVRLRELITSSSKRVLGGTHHVLIPRHVAEALEDIRQVHVCLGHDPERVANVLYFEDRRLLARQCSPRCSPALRRRDPRSLQAGACLPWPWHSEGRPCPARRSPVPPRAP